jgi:hypothetical protein
VPLQASLTLAGAASKSYAAHRARRTAHRKPPNATKAPSDAPRKGATEGAEGGAARRGGGQSSEQDQKGFLRGSNPGAGLGVP